MNRDGRNDLVFANAGPGPDRLCVGDGTGSFACGDVKSLSIDLRVAVGDFDADGNPDATFAAGDTSITCLGDGNGGFACTNTGVGLFATGIAVGRIDGDAHLDLAVSHQVQADRICLGDGTGSFSCSDITLGIGAVDSLDVELTDLDSDGTLDPVFANNGANEACLSTDDNSAGCSGFGPNRNSLGIASGDFDHNGDADVILANFGEPNQVCLGDGTGALSCVDINSDSMNSRDVAVADVDADGLLDAVFANSGQPNRLCLGDGSGGFSCGDVSADANDSRGVVIGPLVTATNPILIPTLGPLGLMALAVLMFGCGVLLLRGRLG